MLCFLGCLLLFSVGVLFSWLSSFVFCGCFGCMALCVPPIDYDREGLLNAIETWEPNLEGESRLGDSDVIVVSWEK